MNVPGGNSNDRETTAGADPARFSLLAALGVVFVLRLVHLGAAVGSPLTYQLGPDEDYYLRFGAAVAKGTAAANLEFAFMDPAYGYLVAGMHALFGPGVYPLFLLQVVVDTVTAALLFAIARELGQRRAGLYAVIAYGFVSTAILFSASVLKATWVANYMSGWVLLALLVVRRQTWWGWAIFGLWCGYGVALRSNLLLLAAAAVPLVCAISLQRDSATWRRMLPGATCFLLALAGPLLLLSLRNLDVSQKFSPIPNNGGVVLHQLYNPENPTAEMNTPGFVRFPQPGQIWRDYVREAESKAGRVMTPSEVDAYWRQQALDYMEANPGQVARNMLRKSGEFVGSAEIANNRSYEQEKLFSPVLRALPAPFAWLFAIGAPGLLLLVRQDARALLLLAPIATAFITVVVFFSEDRFRFHAAPMFALGAGLFVARMVSWAVTGSWGRVLAGLAVSAALAGGSLWMATRVHEQPLNWERVAWGYLKMGRVDEARRVAGDVVATHPRNARMHELLGYVAMVQNRPDEAMAEYSLATGLNPNSDVAHYNLARLLLRRGDVSGARQHALAAIEIVPLPEYRSLLAELESGDAVSADAPKRR